MDVGVGSVKNARAKVREQGCKPCLLDSGCALIKQDLHKTWPRGFLSWVGEGFMRPYLFLRNYRWSADAGERSHSGEELLGRGVMSPLLSCPCSIKQPCSCKQPLLNTGGHIHRGKKQREENMRRRKDITGLERDEKIRKGEYDWSTLCVCVCYEIVNGFPYTSFSESAANPICDDLIQHPDPSRPHSIDHMPFTAKSTMH